LGEDKRDLGTPQTPVRLRRTPLVSFPLCQRGMPGSSWNWGAPLILRRVYDRTLGPPQADHSRGACPREDGACPRGCGEAGIQEKEAHKTRCANGLSTPCPPTLFQPVFARSRKRRGNLGGWRLLRLLLATLGEWLAMTNDWGPVDDEGMDARPDEDDRGLKVRKRPSRRRFLSSNARHRPLSRWFRVSACSSPSVWLRTRRWNRAAQDGSSCHPLTSRTPGP